MPVSMSTADTFPVAAAAGAPRQLFDHDFTADATTATFNNDNEDKTIGGVTPFWPSNSAVRNIFLNTVGVGIEIQDAWNGMRLRSPKLSVLAPSLDFRLPIYVWVRTANATINAAANRCQQGISWWESANSTGAEYAIRSGKVCEAGPINRWRTSVFGIGSASCLTPDSSPIDLTDAVNINDDVMMMKILGPLKVEFYSGAWASGWPAYSALALRASVDASASWAAQPRMPVASTARVDFSCFNSNPTVPPASRCETIIKRLRVDQ